LIDQLPWTRVTLRVQSDAIVWIVVLAEAASEVASLSNVNLSLGIY
jgi:hypothetical protein